MLGIPEFPEFRGFRNYSTIISGLVSQNFSEFRESRNYSGFHNNYYFQLPGFPEFLGIPIISKKIFRIPQLLSLARYPGIPGIRNSGIPKVLRIPQLLFLARYPRIPGIPEFQGIRNSGYSEIIPDPTIIFTSQVSQNSRNSEIIPDSTITVSSLVSQNFPEFRGSRSYYFQLPGIPEFPEFRGFRNYSASHNYFQLPGFPVTLFPEFRNSIYFGIPNSEFRELFRIFFSGFHN